MEKIILKLLSIGLLVPLLFLTELTEAKQNCAPDDYGCFLDEIQSCKEGSFISTSSLTYSLLEANVTSEYSLKSFDSSCLFTITIRDVVYGIKEGDNIFLNSLAKNALTSYSEDISDLVTRSKGESISCYFSDEDKMVTIMRLVERGEIDDIISCDFLTAKCSYSLDLFPSDCSSTFDIETEYLKDISVEEKDVENISKTVQDSTIEKKKNSVINDDSSSQNVHLSDSAVSDGQNNLSTETSCSGCFKKNICYPIGYRKTNIYCDVSHKFLPQKKVDSSCLANFECKQNRCTGGTCEGGIISKTIKWLNIFVW